MLTTAYITILMDHIDFMLHVIEQKQRTFQLHRIENRMNNKRYLQFSSIILSRIRITKRKPSLNLSHYTNNPQALVNHNNHDFNYTSSK